MRTAALTLAALLALTTVPAPQTNFITSVAVPDVGNAVELAANSIETGGAQIISFDRTWRFSPQGDQIVLIWVRATTATVPQPPTPGACDNAPDYDPTQPGSQPPFPGAQCYLDPATGAWGWR